MMRTAPLHTRSSTSLDSSSTTTHTTSRIESIDTHSSVGKNSSPNEIDSEQSYRDLLEEFRSDTTIDQWYRWHVIVFPHRYSCIRTFNNLVYYFFRIFININHKDIASVHHNILNSCF